MIKKFFSTFSSNLLQKIKITDISKKYKHKIPITMLTAYDTQIANYISSSDIDIILIGDSVGMVNMGHTNTLRVTMNDMIHYCKCVVNPSIKSLLIGDMPFGSYEVCEKTAVDNAIRFIKEGNMDAIKLEGNRPETVRKIVNCGIPVMGHIGLTPQQISVIGGFKSQGKDSISALKMIESAIKLQEAGCFAIVIECVPEEVADIITKKISIPTIGIGSGSKTSGQVLVTNDLLGISNESPKFCKRYAELGSIIKKSISDYRSDVLSNHFPSKKYSPYKISEEELNKIL